MQLLAGNTVSDQYLIFFSFPTIFSSFIAFIVVSVVDIRSRGKRADSNDKKIFITSKLLLKKKEREKEEGGQGTMPLSWRSKSEFEATGLTSLAVSSFFFIVFYVVCPLLLIFFCSSTKIVAISRCGARFVLVYFGQISRISWRKKANKVPSLDESGCQPLGGQENGPASDFFSPLFPSSALQNFSK